MGAVGGMLGLGGGQSGSGVSGPSGANVVNFVGANQVAGADQQTNQHMQEQDALLQALQGQQGFAKQGDIYNQLQGIANGTGPNPAQAQYLQNANAIGAQTAGLIGSQKGMNPALQAQMIAQQGASAQQNAAGQGAANLATQQLNAMNASGSMANTMASNQIGQSNANMQARQAYQNSLLSGGMSQNSSNVASQGSVNSANASNFGQIAQQQGQALGGISQGAGMAMGLAAGGEVGDALHAPEGPRSVLGKHFMKMALGGKVQALVSPGEQWLPPKAVHEVMGGKNPLAAGERIPGKPKVKGNSYANDVVPKKLEAGGIVIPNSIMQSNNPAKGARDFVANIIAKRKARG